MAQPKPAFGAPPARPPHPATAARGALQRSAAASEKVDFKQPVPTQQLAAAAPNAAGGGAAVDATPADTKKDDTKQSASKPPPQGRRTAASSLKAGSDNFTETGAEIPAAELDKVKAAFTGVVTGTDKVLLVVGVGAANGNHVNASTVGKVSAASKDAQIRPAFVDSELARWYDRVVVLQFDDFADETTTSGNVTLRKVGARFPLSKSYGAALQHVRYWLNQVTMKGGSFILMNFVTDTFHSGLYTLVEPELNKKVDRPKWMYLSQYLEKGSKIRCWTQEETNYVLAWEVTSFDDVMFCLPGPG